jgi:hypothetical protein
MAQTIVDEQKLLVFGVRLGSEFGPVPRCG